MEKGERDFRTLSEFSEYDLDKEINNDEDDYCELDIKEYIPPYRNIYIIEILLYFHFK